MLNASDHLINHVPEKKPEETALQTVEDTSNCREAGYYLGDSIFAAFVVAPLVVTVWRGTWGIMELHPQMFPHAQTYILGIVIHISFALIRSQLFARSQDAWGEGRAGRWLRERFLSRIYTYIFILACVMHWRGGFGLFDASVVAVVPDANNPHQPVLICAFTLLLYMSICCLRSARNLLASPYFLCTDGKESTYLFTTRFNKPGKKNLLFIPKVETERSKNSSWMKSQATVGMLGSMLLLETLSGKTNEAILEVIDILFTALIAGPLIIIHWRSLWALMDLYVYPDDPLLSAAWTAAFGIVFGLLLCVGQELLNRNLTPDVGKTKYFILTRLYTCIACVVNVAACRGVWNLLDCTLTETTVILITTAVATIAIIYLKGLRNVDSAPFCIQVDSPEDYFEAPTFYKTSSKETALYILDCVFSVTVVGSLVVFVWRGSWALLDIFLYPGDTVKSCWTSLVVGYALVVLTFAAQAPMRWLVARCQGAPRLLLADLYHLVSFIATVNVWRGVWGLMDIYFFPETPKLSNWCSHIISLALLILLNCSNSVLVRGVYIDAEEPAGDCVVFPCHYLRLYFHKERVKKRHKKTLASTTKGPEEANVPLQTPEEKV